MDDRSPLLSPHYRLCQAYDGLVGESVALEGAVVYASARFPGLPNACHAGDFVGVPDAATALRELDAFYAPRGARCGRVRPAAGIDPAAMVEPLTAAGYAPGSTLAWSATSAAAERPAPSAVRFVAARALRRAHTALLTERAGAGADPRLIEHELDRLDSPQFDVWVAQIDGAACGCVALLQVGPVGGIFDLFVRPASRRRGVGGALVRYALGAARRWTLRQVLAGCDESNAPARALATRLGFRLDGILPVFRRPEWVEWGA